MAMRPFRFYLCLVLGSILVLIFFLPHRSLPSQVNPQQYIAHTKEWFTSTPSEPTIHDASDEMPLSGDTDYAFVASAQSIPSDATSSLSASSTTQVIPATKTQSATSANESMYNREMWFFEADLSLYSLPKFNTSKLSTLPPRNYKGPGHATYATYFASRNGTMLNPYFLAAQQIVYRLLWDRNSRTYAYPVTVFVAPFVPEEQRDYFRAAGALVREIDLIPFTPNTQIAGRLQDLFSKLGLWNQTEFSRILYLDSDAFPLANVDVLFYLALEQGCREDLLPMEDKVRASEICRYVFAGWKESENAVNAGVMILKPNEAMYSRLVRECKDTSKFDNGLAEQAFLNYAFRQDGPFPPWTIGHEYNGDPGMLEAKQVKILHAKIWTNFFPVGHPGRTMFNETWQDMMILYQSDEFERLRAKDGLT